MIDSPLMCVADPQGKFGAQNLHGLALKICSESQNAIVNDNGREHLRQCDKITALCLP
jgi:hypothetical protein